MPRDYNNYYDYNNNYDYIRLLLLKNIYYIIIIIK